MPYLVKPTSDEGRLNMVKKSLETNLADATAGINLLSEETVQKSTTVSAAFDNALKALTGTLAERSREVREKNEAISNLERHIRDLWETTKRRVYRTNLPAESLTFYMLPLDGTVPDHIDGADIFALASQIVEGDKKAVLAGYPAAVNPSALELNAALKSAIKESSEVAPADRKMSNAQEALAVERVKMEETIQDIISDLNYFLRKKDPPTRRRIMRRYGVTFAYAPGEPEEPQVP